VSLTGKRVVMTRAWHQIAGLQRRLNDAGAIATVYPCIEIQPSDTPAHHNAIEQVEYFDWLIVTSANTAYALSRWPLTVEAVKIAAVGATTAAAIREHLGAAVDFTPPIQLAGSLAATLPLQAGERVFLPQSARADDSLAAALRGRGASVTAVRAYQTVIGSGGADLPALLAQHQIDAITFTSGSTVENLTARLGGQTPVQVPAACIGPSTGAVATDYGYQTVIIPERDYSLNGMIDGLAAYFT
jgi:uroporphyrinogen III methyltransferase / synthase